MKLNIIIVSILMLIVILSSFSCGCISPEDSGDDMVEVQTQPPENSTIPMPPAPPGGTTYVSEDVMIT